jgi:rhodanese-related sulfurtransferase
MTARTANILRISGALTVAALTLWFANRHVTQTKEATQELGTVFLNLPRKLRVELVNDGTEPRGLKGATPQCSCLQVIFAPSIIPAKGRASIEVLFTPEKPGPVKAELSLEWQDQKKDSRFVTAEVTPPPEALPSSETIAAARRRLENQTLVKPAAALTTPIPGRLVVDVRPSEAYQQGTIPGAMNLPLSGLTTLPQNLRKKPILLVDRGLSDSYVVQLAEKLRADGWEGLQVLEGGLPAWQAHGGAVSTAMPFTNRLVNAEEARVSCTLPGWVTVAPLRLATSWHTQELFPDQLTYDHRESAAEIAKKLGEELSKRRPGDGATTSVLHILVATESGENSVAIAEALQPLVPGCPVFVLDGGLRSYLLNLRHLKQSEEHRWVTLQDYRGALADLRARQRLVASCSSCSR